MVLNGTPAAAVSYARRQKVKLSERLRRNEKEVVFSQIPEEGADLQRSEGAHVDRAPAREKDAPVDRARAREKNAPVDRAPAREKKVPVDKTSAREKEARMPSVTEKIRGKEAEKCAQEGNILYGFVAREGIILAEACLPAAATSDPVSQEAEDSLLAGKVLACKFLASRIPPGWDHAKDFFHQFKCKATRLGLHDCADSSLQFCCAYTKDYPKPLVCKLLEKLVLLSSPLHSSEWAPGACSYLVAQDSFGPILEQQLVAFSSQDPRMQTLRRVHRQVDEVQAILAANVEKLLDRGEKLEEMELKSQALTETANAFKKGARTFKRWHLMNQAKWGIAAGTALTASVVVPVVILTAL
eukprot:CAMPEP_0196585214 /NCGR_PEP_ID=MMETSP1081-20130531/49875_1 /TAXON_ID=36882 /ORGANISM="Pyramimonas amylifera, Strain CCMP720" /LENGTH=355 /DNA_ID=CAMNT_0041906685 /DNA_START=133 /DNA_END=1200 /DNA_ORIENTATION=+